MENDKKIENVELLKLSFDWCKHISTLSTGSILLMVSFLEKLSQQPSWKLLLPVALISFVCAILGTLGVQLEHLIEAEYKEPTTFGIVAGFATLFGFLIGIIALAAFGVKNLS
ncbi:hypothetical protein [Pseudoalteromonas piscicida]